MQLTQLLEKLFEQKKEKIDQSVDLSWADFCVKGLPAKDQEAFRYVGIKKLENLFSKEEIAAEKSSFEKDLNTIYFINGRLEKLDEAIFEPLVVENIKDALKSYGPLLRGRFASFVKEEKDPFAMLNHALFEEGLFVYVPPNTVLEKPLTINFVYEGSHLVSSPKILFYLGKNSKVELKLTMQMQGKSYLSNRFLEVHQEENSSFSMLNEIGGDESFCHFDAIRGFVKKNASFHYVSCVQDGNVQRQDLKVDLLEEGAEATLKGLSFLEGKTESHVHVLVRHLSPNCVSNQHFKSVLMGSSRTSFEGKIFVDPIAQKTRAYQLHNALMLSDSAHVFAKPNLEIFADDVKASHGTTITQPKGEDLFYLQARGISKESGKRLLVKGFCKEILEDFFDKNLSQHLLKSLIQKGS